MSAIQGSGLEGCHCTLHAIAEVLCRMIRSLHVDIILQISSRSSTISPSASACLRVTVYSQIHFKLELSFHHKIISIVCL